MKEITTITTLTDDLSCPEKFTEEKLAIDDTALSNDTAITLNTQALTTWQAFICADEPAPSFLNPAIRLFFDYFMSIRMQFREIAVDYKIIENVNATVTADCFAQVVKHISADCHVPTCSDFCESVEELSWFQIIEMVSLYFSKYAELIALPHSDREQFNKFRSWKPRISKMCDAFNEKIQTECLTTKKLRLAYVKAVAGKKTLDPLAPPTDHLLTEGHIEPLMDFLYNNPTVAAFLYNNIETVITLGEHYYAFCRENAAHETSVFFHDPEHLHLLRKLTAAKWQVDLKEARYAEKHAPPLSKPYPFATECLKFIKALKEFRTHHANSDAWSELQYILHGTNTHEPLQQLALLLLLKANPDIAFFFYAQFKELTLLAAHYKTQCSIPDKHKSSNSTMLFKEQPITHYANSDAWPELQHTLHGTNTGASLQQLALLVLLKANPDSAVFFYEQLKELITLATHYKTPCSTPDKYKSNSPMLFLFKLRKSCQNSFNKYLSLNNR